MIRHTVILWLSSLAGIVAADRPDLLRFTNSDQLHGTFLGIKEGPLAVWQREDLAAPVEFKTGSVRHVVLNGGRPRKAIESLSHAVLVNGDRIPGVIAGIDGEQIILDSPTAGVLRIPRGQVAMLAPNPLGGRVYYHGPFSEDDWKMTHAAFPAGLPEVAADADAGGKPEEEADDDGETPPGLWVHSGAAWYWQHKTAGTALIRETGMPDRAVITLDLAWKNRLNLVIGFHSDFAPVKESEKEDGAEKKARIRQRGFVPGDSSSLPRYFGNSYVLQLVSNYLMLFRTSVDEEGNPSLDRIQMQNNSLRLGDSGSAKLEIRSNRRKGGISLFVNDEFIAQWSESDLIDRAEDKFAVKGAGFGFVAQGADAQIRISDIIVSEWNGMPDSARSLQVEERDVVLMGNGTDRYTGKVSKLDEEGKVIFEGKHGDFRIPLEEVAEIRFARNQLASAGEPPSDNVVVRLNPLGSISGRPIVGDPSSLSILSPIVGELNLSLESAVMLDFNASNQFIDDWDADL